MKIHSGLPIALIGATLIAFVPQVTNARNLAVAPISVQTSAGTTYLNGGIGKGETEAMRQMAKEFPLRLTFSERKDGEFIADVPIVISDVKGNSVFELPKAGPMLYVKLPNGKYKISARFKGVNESREVTLNGKEGKDIYFHWKGTPKG